MRERQQIRGGCCGDCTTSLCCYPCTTAQLYTECRSGAHEEHKKQKRMEDMLEEQAQHRISSPAPAPATTTTIVYAGAPSPPMSYQQVYPVHQPVAVPAGGPYPQPSPSGKDAGYLHGARAAY